MKRMQQSHLIICQKVVKKLDGSAQFVDIDGTLLSTAEAKDTVVQNAVEEKKKKKKYNL